MSKYWAGQKVYSGFSIRWYGKKKNDSMEKSKGTFFANPIFSILGNVATQCLAIGNSIQG